MAKSTVSHYVWLEGAAREWFCALCGAPFEMGGVGPYVFLGSTIWRVSNMVTVENGSRAGHSSISFLSRGVSMGTGPNHLEGL